MFFKKIKDFLNRKDRICLQNLESFEELLYEADMGPKMVQEILDQVKQHLSLKKEINFSEIQLILKEILLPKLINLPKQLQILEKPTVVMVVGINGVGKTTTVAKIAKVFHEMGKKVLMVSTDTFRAAAQDQLEIWSKRSGVPLFESSSFLSPSALVFDALDYAKQHFVDLVLIDTAGRMHTAQPLMAEIQKMKNIIQKKIIGAPHEILMVLDVNVGQNALEQSRDFHKNLGLTGLILSKIDGTAKGGVLFTITEALSLPVLYVTMGENLEDLLPFRPEAFLAETLASKS